MSTTEEKKPFPEYIDSSMRGTLSGCQTAFRFSYIENLAVSEGSVHLVAGGAFARGLEVVRKEYYSGRLTAPEAIEAGCYAAMAEYGDFQPPPGSNKTLPRVVEAISHYFQTWPLYSDHIQPWKLSNGEPAVEFSASLPLEVCHPVTGNPIIYCGKFDMLGEYNKLCFVVDEKTTSQLGQSWLKNWTLRSQQTGYTWLARESGYKVEGAIIRGISFLKSSFGTAEVIEHRPDWMVQRWKRQLEKDVARAIKAWEQDDYDLALDTACSNYGGCQFQQLCLSPNPERWYDQYVTRTWSPIKMEED